ncbi:hypothetical protein N7537_002760 [Penicillium hordei]|uniref:Uncharacterized protein n=1 Tax=Penicillium hordei TaxID=40994 RepID=A0AAD6EIK0_9EURO|nr:uncharacterized protein N7537_002760 [Penicillium hordei]KAJ5617646.1 hypothetical protein N7537_002760 [Penicillium hordei]
MALVICNLSRSTEGADPASSNIKAKKVEADINEGGMTPTQGPPKRKNRSEKENQQDPNEESMAANHQG